MPAHAGQTQPARPSAPLQRGTVEGPAPKRYSLPSERG